MQITFDNPGFPYSIQSILLFQTADASDWWRDSLYFFYPQVDRERMEHLAGREREAYLRSILLDVYCSLVPELAEKKEAYQRHWEENRRVVEEALGMALHEVVHFLWFDRWNALFHDDPAEYEAPYLKWLFSEMAVKPILGEPRLAERNPYYPDDCVYAYFDAMTVEGRPILEVMEEFFAAGNIDRFMAEGWRFCREHEREICRQVK